MALPLIAAGIAARVVAKKLASRAAGGITGKGAKQVNPMYKNMDKQVTPLSKNVKVKQTEKQREAAIRAEYDEDMKNYSIQQSQQMRDYMTSGENFSNIKKINSSKLKPNKIVKPKSALPKRGK
jgi:hypothetical protein